MIDNLAGKKGVICTEAKFLILIKIHPNYPKRGIIDSINRV